MLSVLASVGALLLATTLMQFANGMFYAMTAVRLAADGVSPLLIGLVGAAFFTGFCAGPFLAVWMIRVVGHIRGFTVCASVICTGGLLMALFDAPLAWAGARLTMGLGLAGLITVTESWLNERGDMQTRGQVLAIYMILCGVAQAGGTLLVAQLDPWTFVPYTIGAILFALCLAPVALTRASHPTPPESAAIGFGRLFAISPLGVAGAFGSGVMLSAIFSLAPAYVLSSGFEDAGVAATFQSVAIFGTLILGWPIGKISDIADRRAVLIGAAFGLCAVSLALALESQSGSTLALYALGAAYGGLAVSLYLLGVSHANDWLEPWERVGASAGLLVVFGVGAAIGPQALGAAMDVFGAHGLFFSTAGLALALALFAIYRRIIRPARPNDEQAPFVAAPRTTFMVAELDPIYEPDPQYSFDFDGDGVGDFDEPAPA